MPELIFKKNKKKKHFYLGIASLRDQQEETIVIDWRAPIANLYYEGELGETFYETETDRFTVELLLKRQFKNSRRPDFVYGGHVRNHQ